MIGRIIFALAVSVVGLSAYAVGSEPAFAGSRVALVIGNAGYQTAPLRNPINDARAMASALDELGFDVLLVEDADRSQMALAIQEFAALLNSHSVGLFYYAGHGVQARGRNFLLPVDAKETSERALQFEAINVAAFLRGCNLTTDNLVRLQMHITKRGYIEISRQARIRHLGEHMNSAVTGVIVVLFDPGLVIEIDGIAAA